ncbi:MAG: hypothetical protein U0Q18_03930 [Bryobacteraceae bacterium]
MAVRPLKSFFPTADDLLAADLPSLGEVLLVHLNGYEDRVKQLGGLNRGYFRAILENRNVGLGPLPPEPEYGPQQLDVTKRMMEAWNWLEREGLLMHNPDQPAADWFIITTTGEELLSRLGRFEHWERFGLDQVKADLEHTGGLRAVGGGPGVAQMAWNWVRMKEGQAMMPVSRRGLSGGGSSFIAESRIEELRKLPSPDFDLQKLIRLCEELNSSYDNGNYYATAMLTRGVLDHVPPLFGHQTFAQVANNYSGGGRSFKETMQHLDGAARKVSDAHLHMPIRKRETLPTPQQVYCASQLDVMLSEIVRIMR